ncbi:MAG: methylglyoxal synthase [Myxococcota bacterium]
MAKSTRTPTIALIAHDHRKPALVEWCTFNQETLVKYDLVATGTTGQLLADALGTEVTCLHSGPLGGDQEMGALIAQGRIDLVVFFWDPLAPMPHDPDVKALLRLAVVWNVPMACNRSTADYLISSPLFLQESYEREVPDFSAYTSRFDDET